MSRFLTGFLLLSIFFFPSSLLGQVVETDPDQPRTDQPVTIYFNADEGTGGLENHSGDVYAHTGISTDQNPDRAWKCVKNHWPTSDDFNGNRTDTKLTEVSTNRYKLEITDIRSYYQNTSTSCSLGSDEEVQTMNFVFRNADGSKEGKAEGGDDIFVDVFDASGGDPSVQAQIVKPNTDPLYPLITTTDTTVTIEASAQTANVDQFTGLSLFVNGNEEAQAGFGQTSLQYDLMMDAPDHYDLKVIAEAFADGETIKDTLTKTFTQTPSVATESRPSGVSDGINYNSDGSVTLSLYAPNKDFVYAVGDFTNWEVDNSHFMKRDGDHWWVTVDGLNGGQQYDFQYLVDGERRVADPFSKKVRGPSDASINDEYTVYPGLESYPAGQADGFVTVIEPGQDDFNFSSFNPPPQDELVVYELLLRDFLEQHSFSALTDTLDYLDRLGINAIELMPVSNFGSNSSWGYNPNFHFALDKSYGPPEDFKQFVEAAHNRGIAVILDVVYNHVTDQSPFYQLYSSAADSPFIDANASGTCGNFFRRLAHSDPYIQDYVDRANKYWIEEYNVDGFRFDLAKCLGRGNGSEDGVKRMADYVWDNVDSDAYMILEYFGGFEEEKRLANYRNGLIPWNKLSGRYGQASMGYVSTGDGSNIRPTYFGFAGFEEPNLMAYMESHDEQWLMHKNASFGNATADGSYDVKNLQTALGRQKLVGAFFFTVPGPRMTWQFAELGYGYAEDECLQDDGGADNCPDSAPSRTAEKPVRWGYRDPQQSPNRVRLYKTWQALLRLRNQYEVFRAPRVLNNSEEDITMQAGDGDFIRWIQLKDEEMDAVVVGNFDVIARSVQIPFTQEGTWHNFFETQSREVTFPTQSVQLRPGEFRVYTSEPVAPPEPGLLSFPAERSTQTVSSSGTQDFGNTGVDINFASGTSGSGDVTVETFERGPFRADIGRANVSDYRYTIEAGGNLSVGSGTEVRLDVSTLDGIDDPNKVDIYRRSTPNEGSFTQLSTSYDSGANELVATTGSFSEFVLASDTEPLPVELAGFAATRTEGQTVRLSWQTASETNNAGFQVQRRVLDAASSAGRSGDGASGWSALNFVEGAGTTGEPQSYRLDDTVPYEADSVQYRLKQVDADGSEQFSDPVGVTIGAPDQLALRAAFPNPVRRRATIQYAVPTRQDVSVVLYDMLGRRVRTLTRGPKEGRYEHGLDVSGLSSGTYFLRIQGEQGLDTQRLTVVK